MAATDTHGRPKTAVDDLYRRHVGDVYRYTYAVLGNHADAEDVTQTTFVNALRALERGEQPRNAANWLLVIAHNLVRQRWRQAASRPAEVELVHDVPASDSDSDVELDSLVKALQRIPPAQREAIVMRELEGRSYREISELLSLSTSALETLLFRARRSLAEELENVVTCETAELAISKRLDGRLGRKERRRLATHLEECPTCTRLAEMQTRQRRAFKGLALLPLPVGLALFKGAPAATAAVGLPAIGGVATGGGLAGAAGTAGSASTAIGSATAVGAAGAGGGAAAAGGTLLGGAAAKVATVVVAASVATGVGYEGVKAVRDAPAKTPSGVTRPAASEGSGASRPAASGASAVRERPTSAPRASAKAATPTSPVKARGTTNAPGLAKRSELPGTRAGQEKGRKVERAAGRPTAAERARAGREQRRATPTRRGTAKVEKADRQTARAPAKGTGASASTSAKADAATKRLARSTAQGAGASAAAGSDAAKAKEKGKTASAPTAPEVPETPGEPVAETPPTTTDDPARGGDKRPESTPGKDKDSTS